MERSLLLAAYLRGQTLIMLQRYPTYKYEVSKDVGGSAVKIGCLGGKIGNRRNLSGFDSVFRSPDWMASRFATWNAYLYTNDVVSAV